jgi:hypothetical protein
VLRTGGHAFRSPEGYIEVICSDREEHRRRVESRTGDVPGLRLPTWEAAVNREYETWDRPHVVVDTAGQTIEQSFAALGDALQREGHIEGVARPEA